MILDGKLLAEKIAGELKQRAIGKKVRLAVILVGSDPASAKYVAAKQKRAIEIGIECEIIRLPETAAQSELMARIKELNDDAKTTGLMTQLPLPKHMDWEVAARAIDPAKDVDGLNPASGFMPATVRGIEKLLEYYKIETDGKIAVVVGRGKTAGRPAAEMLLSHDATVIQCHTHTRDLAAMTRQADILVLAAGRKGLITGNHVKDGVVIIDAGGGDAAAESLAKASAYTPAIGGVGPMTIVSLIENAINAVA